MEERKVRREGAGEEGREELDKEQYSCAVSFWTAFLVALSWRTGGPTRMSADRGEGMRAASRELHGRQQGGGGSSASPAGEAIKTVCECERRAVKKH